MSERPKASTLRRGPPIANYRHANAGVELRYQKRPRRGHLVPPLGRGFSSFVPSAGQNL
ncbi:MAG TPA: hypothetical protein VK357_06350 [Rubrobacteraceae bacterium]|nr:hypothetical protein [Rubrobacteraceae bacterium]